MTVASSASALRQRRGGSAPPRPPYSSTSSLGSAGSGNEGAKTSSSRSGGSSSSSSRSSSSDENSNKCARRFSSGSSGRLDSGGTSSSSGGTSSSSSSSSSSGSSGSGSWEAIPTGSNSQRRARRRSEEDARATPSSSSSTSVGRSLLLGAITFAAVLVAAAPSSHESFFFADRLLSLGGGGGVKDGTTSSNAKTFKAAAYIAPPPGKASDSNKKAGSASTTSPASSASVASSSSSSSTSGADGGDGVASLAPPPKVAQRKTNPFGRLVRELVTRRARNEVVGDGRAATAAEAEAEAAPKPRRWLYGASWDDATAADSKASEPEARFTKAMAAELRRRFPTAYTELAPCLTSDDLAHLQQYANVVQNHFDDDDDKAAADPHGAPTPSSRAVAGLGDWRKAATSPSVAWGGGGGGGGGGASKSSPHLSWWDAAQARRGGGTTSAADLDRLEGGNVLYSYYRIMKAIHDQGKHKKEPFDLSNVHFPLKKCHPPNGCSAAVAIHHTLQWRASYQPWKVNAKVLKDNSAGWVYARGWGTTPDDPASKAPPRPDGAEIVGEGGGAHGRHAVLWSRPGIHRAGDSEGWIRTVLHGADLAVAQSLRASGGRVGKFNAVIDVTGFEWGRTLPAIGTLQRAVAALQDHFPNRLGVVVLLNLGRGAEIVVNLIKPWLTKDVRDKIHVLSVRDLPLLVDHESIPSWLGGPDDYAFDVDEYYPPRVRF